MAGSSLRDSGARKDQRRHVCKPHRREQTLPQGKPIGGPELLRRGTILSLSLFPQGLEGPRHRRTVRMFAE